MSELYVIILTVTTGILSIVCGFSFQQLCITHIDDKDRINKALYVVIVNLLGVILNILFYSSYMYPKAILLFGLSVEMTESIFEAISIIITFYVLIKFVLSIIDRLHFQLNIKPPKFIRPLFYSMLIIVIIMVLICYSFTHIFNDWVFMHIFHITLAIVIFIETMVVLRSLLKLR